LWFKARLGAISTKIIKNLCENGGVFGQKQPGSAPECIEALQSLAAPVRYGRSLVRSRKKAKPPRVDIVCLIRRGLPFS
jgi:hypothetical protein